MTKQFPEEDLSPDVNDTPIVALAKSFLRGELNATEYVERFVQLTRGEQENDERG